jgi:hypothetical protein
MNECLFCKEKTSNPKFCSHSCSAKFSNSTRVISNITRIATSVSLQRYYDTKQNVDSNNDYYVRAKTRINRNCSKLDYTGKLFCNASCHKNFQYVEYIKDWKLTGKSKSSIGLVSAHIKRYIRDKFDNKCARCGWHEINPFTNNIPLEIEHIDGNYMNNTEDNLILLCPNCHSLTKTYKGANRGNGRTHRKRGL